MNMKCLIFLSLLYYLIINPAYPKCRKSFDCGKLGSLQFPLTRDSGCGLFMVDDCDSDHPKVQLETGRRWYDILYNVSPNSFFIRDPELQRMLNDRNCTFLFENVSLPKSPYSSFTISPNLTVSTCTREDLRYYFGNYTQQNCTQFAFYYKDPSTGSVEVNSPPQCLVSQVPLKSNRDQDRSSELFDLLTAEFTLEWNVNEDCYKCYLEGGQCLTNSMNEFVCRRGGRKFNMVFVIGGVVALAATFTISILFVRRKYIVLRLFRKAYTGNGKGIEVFLKNNGNLAPLRYNYSDIKKMTKSFSENLGKGGYGSVYKGKLPDGRLVAVKILKESQGNGEEFMNEVASISRTSHINIVTLLGFCFERSKQALIYEFMPNGSLEKFIHTTSSLLEWQKLFEIAVGIARGLEYLHQGCNTRILHFDIKPHNILLDKDFNPRISDFGLAKLCPNRSSIVSMLVARGTIGYIAPEVFCRNFGEVSHKSDVYSYGMMVLEIAAGGKKSVDPRDVDHSSEAYFPHYIYKQLEMDEVDIDCSHDGIVNEDESRYAKRKLTIVGLWCIQTVPRDRPSMTKVVEMLEGKLESLQVPPKPCLSSPPRSALSFSASESV